MRESEKVHHEDSIPCVATDQFWQSVKVSVDAQAQYCRIVGWQGARAQAFVQKWDWGHVAAQYAGLISGDDMEPLSTDPFAEAPAIAATAEWNDSNVVLPNGNTWNFRFLATRPSISIGAHALYIDVDIQARPAAPHLLLTLSQ